MGISASDLASLRALRQEFMPDVATITRLGTSYPVRVADNDAQVRIEGMPRFLPLRQWRLLFPDTTPCQVWDEVTIAGKGTYLVTHLANPQSLSTSTDAFAIASQPSIVAETHRKVAVLDDVQSVGGNPVHLQRLLLRYLGTSLFTSVSAQVILDTFGQSVAGLYRVCVNFPQPADYLDPSNAGENYPVAIGDTIILPDRRILPVRFVETYAPTFLVLYVALKETGFQAQADPAGDIVHDGPGGNILLAH